MKKDYSEYKHTDYEKYNIARQSNSYVYYDFFINFASFDPDAKLFSIKVDRVNEDLSMKEAIDEFEELERSLREVRPDILSDEDIADYEQSRVKGLEKTEPCENISLQNIILTGMRVTSIFKTLWTNMKLKRRATS